MIIRARTPLRISYAGGGTDVDPFKEKYGGIVLNSAINKFCHGTLSSRSDGIGIHSYDLGISLKYDTVQSMMYDGNLDLVKAVLKHVQEKATGNIGGFDIELYCDAPPGSGLGTSSAVVVTILGLLFKAYGITKSPYEIAQMAWIIERREMDMAGGFQDQYSAVFGGQINFMEFGCGFNNFVNQIRLDHSVMNEFRECMSLFFTGGLHKSHDIIRDQMKDEEIKAGYLLQMKLLAIAMKNILLKGNLREFGPALRHEWEVKKNLSKMITNEMINTMEKAAFENGATGLKVTGAGGGGMMMIYSDPMKKIAIGKVLQKLGAVPVDFEFVKPGMEAWIVNE